MAFSTPLLSICLASLALWATFGWLSALHSIVVDFDAAIADIFDERLPVVEGWKVHFPFLT